MKTKQKIDMCIEASLLLLGLVMIVFGIFSYSNIKVMFVSALFIYAIFNLVQYVLTRKSKDMEGLYTGLSSIIIGIIDIYVPFNNNIVLPMSIMGWAMFMSVIKLIKADYYNDRKDKTWKFKIATLVLFMVVSILTSIALNYNSNVQVLIIGYYFLINGILELSEVIVKYLIGK